MRHRGTDIAKENTRLGELAPAALRVAGIATVIGVVGSLVLAFAREDGFRRLLFSYLVNFSFFLSLALGALFFVILHHLVRAGWSVVVRRIAEAIAANLWVLAVLAVPIVLGIRELYPWADTAIVAHDPILVQKRGYLNPVFFVIRLALYFTVWTFLARYFFVRSVAQDRTREITPTVQMERRSGVAMVLFALTTAFASYDLLMSLDPHWYSTIFGVYFFSGGVLAFFATLPIVTSILQSRGRLVNAITEEHYHDMGKLIFAFTVFWAYIAFSQYMLIWYANLPEETIWYLRRQTGSWQIVSIMLIFGHFLLPFLVLLPRWIKRNRRYLVLPALWMLAMHWMDIYWIAMPEMSPEGVPLGFMDLACFLAVGGLFVGAATRRLRDRALVPEGDPRLEESLAFESV
jgi:hypothetical protein